MKQFIYPFITALLLTACSLDINDDPNSPNNDLVTADLIFPTAQSAIAASSCDIMFNYAGFFAQYFDQAPNSGQFDKLCYYSFSENDSYIERAYSNIYSIALSDLKVCKEKVTAKADLLAIAALRAFAFQLMVDNMGEAPYSEALMNNENTQPKWDNGEYVYQGILKETLNALNDYQAQPDKMTLTDMMFNNDMEQWVGYTNALRLRMLLRLYETQPSVESEIISLVQKNQFFTGDVTLDIYSNNTNNRSPFYASVYSMGINNHVACYPILSYYLDTDDPRISYAFNKATNTGTYVGQIPGAGKLSSNWSGNKNWTYNDVSLVNYELSTKNGVSRPAYLFTQANLQFLIAEVQLRFLHNEAAAKAAYTAAITSDFLARGLTAADAMNFLNGPKTNWDLSDNKLHLIYMQKWASLFYMDNMEAWSEIRRNDVPELSKEKATNIFKNPAIYTPGDMIEPAINAIEAGGLVKRMCYPVDARKYNVNTPPFKKLNVRVWWDVK